MAVVSLVRLARMGMVRPGAVGRRIWGYLDLRWHVAEVPMDWSKAEAFVGIHIQV
jgi:hypothetical protein